MTDALPPSPQPTPSPSRRRRLGRRLLFAAGGIVAAALLLTLLLPSLLSTRPARSLALGQVNKRLHGTVDVNDWSLGWFGSQRVKGVTVSDAEGRPVLHVEGITVPRGLTAFLGSRYDLGTVVVTAPKMHVVFAADGTTNLEGLIPAAKPGVAAPPPASRPLGIDVFGEVVVENGEVSLTPPGGAAPFRVSDLQLRARLDGLNNPITVDQSAKLGDAGAPESLRASVTAFKDGLPAGDALTADATLSVTDFDLASADAALALLGAPVRLRGRLTMTHEAQVRGLKSVTARGALALKDFEVSGDALQGDTLRMASFDTRYDAALDGDAVRIADMRVESPLLTAAVSGALTLPATKDALPSGAIEAEAAADLAGIARQLPKTLSLRPGLTMEQGRAALKASVVSRGPALEVTADLAVRDVAAVKDGKRLALDQPILLTAKAAVADRQPRLDALHLQSSFCTLDAQGGLARFEAALSVDLAAAMREAEKFADLGGARADGRMTFAALMKGPDLQERRIESVLKLNGVVVEGVFPRSVRVPDAQVTLAGVARLSEDMRLQAVEDVRADVQSAPLTAQAAAARIAPAATGLPTVSGAHVEVRAALKDLLALGRQMAEIPANLETSGEASVVVDVSVSDGVVNAERFAATVSNLDVAVDGKRLREPQIAVSGSARAWPAARKAEARDVTLAFSGGRAVVARADAPDWSLLPNGLAAETTGEIDLAKTLAALGDFVKLPEGARVAGTARWTLSARGEAQRQRVAAEVALADVKAAFPDQPPIEEKEATLKATAWVDPAVQSIQMDALALNSSLAKITAQGTFSEWASRRRLKAEGVHELDFERIGPLAAAFTGKPIALSGRKAQPFHVEASLAETGWRRVVLTLLAGTEVTVARLKYLDIEGSDLRVPFDAKDGVASVKVLGALLGGTVDVPVLLDVREGPGVVTIPGEPVVVRQVKITDVVAGQFLARVSPVFREAIVAGGTVTVLSERMRLPLEGEPAQVLDFKGVLVFEDVELKSSGFLRGLLDAVGAGKVGITLPNQRVPIEVRNGRIVQGPMVVRFMDVAMNLSGTIGLDGTVDMIAALPLTRALVKRFGGSEQVFGLLEGQVLRVPIKGVRSTVEFTGEFLKKNLGALIEAATKNLLIREGGKLLEDLLGGEPKKTTPRERGR